ANIDEFDPSKPASDPKKRAEVDRWILSELSLMVLGVTKDLDGYDVYTATGKISSFVDALSNWYVRRSRERFWRAGWDEDKRAAYETLWSCLVTIARVMAPFTPYLSESIYRNLVVKGVAEPGEDVLRKVDWPESVHLT